MTSSQSVLVVDGLPETEEVLRAVLEPRGLQVNRIRSHEAAQTETTAPGVIVLHEEAAGDMNARSWEGVPRIVIGSVEMPETVTTAEHHLRAPFQYAELVNAIEQVLARRAA